MDDPAANQTPGENFNKIDLTALEAFQFGTQWTDAGQNKSGDRGHGEHARTPGGDPSAPRRDRRPPRPRSEHDAGAPGQQAPGGGGGSAPQVQDRPGPRPGGYEGGGGNFDRRPRFDRSAPSGGGAGGGQRFDRGGGGGGGGAGRFDQRGGDQRFDRGGPRRPAGPPRPYESPVFEITFYPDDHGFTALVKAMRASCRTYELFEIARLILGKPERCVVVLRRRAAEGAPPDAPRAPLAISVPTGLPFDTEEEAINFSLEKGLEPFFTSEVVEVEPPKGTFQFVNRCPVTKDLLGPPNYHRYAQIVQQHYLTRGFRMPFESYKASIEVVRDPEAVTRWLESMKKVTRFTFKGELPAGEQGVFDNFDDARAFLVRTCRDRIVRTVDSTRIGAKIVEAATATEAFRAMSGAVDMQRRFPLDTANALRGRLRRENFNIFKRGSKGVTYVCSVRRKFRQPGQTFSDSINSLIEFLDQNPMVPVSELAPKLLGFAAPAPAAPTPTPVPVAAVVAAPEGEASAEGAPVDAPAATPVEASEAAGPTPEQRTALNRLMLDLRWLVTEGYVAEYSDGRLVAHPVMTPQAQAQAERAERAGESVPDHLPDPTTTPVASVPAKVEVPPAPVETPAAESPPAEEPPPAEPAAT